MKSSFSKMVNLILKLFVMEDFRIFIIIIYFLSIMNCVRYIKSELLEKWLYTGKSQWFQLPWRFLKHLLWIPILIPLWQWFMDFFLENNSLGCALVKLLHWSSRAKSTLRYSLFLCHFLCFFAYVYELNTNLLNYNIIIIKVIKVKNLSGFIGI